MVITTKSLIIEPECLTPMLSKLAIVELVPSTFHLYSLIPCDPSFCFNNV
jgi:hypothetical protein